MQCVDMKQIDVLSEQVKVEVEVEMVLGKFKIVLDFDLVVAQINFDDFVKIDMRIVKIVIVSYVDGVDKLLQLMFDLGGEIW